VIVVDTSVLLDVVLNDPVWGIRSRQALDDAMAMGELVINDIVYAELSTRYPTIEAFETVLASVPLKHRPIPKPALFLAAKAFRLYRQRGGTKTGVLPDFFIGAHAATTDAGLLTRDPSQVRSYFPGVVLVTP
jgi:predicted nucleic acid-binding protein